MKKTLIASVVATALFAMSSVAYAVDDVTITGNKTIELEEISRIIAEQKVSTSDSVAVATAILALYQSKGLMATKVKVDKKTGLITVTERTIKNGGGKYSEYFDDTVSQADLNLSYKRMSGELNANNEKVELVLSDDINDPNIAVLTTKATKADSPTGSGLITLTNLGSKYTSSYILTAQGKKKVGNGVVIDGTVSKGIPELTDDAKGGDVTVFEAGATKHSIYGATNIRLTNSEYEVGGDYEDFGIKGESTKVSAGHKYILNNKTVLSGGLNLVQSEVDISAAKIDSSYNFGSVFAEASSRINDIQVTLNVEQGFAGSEDFNVTPIHGEFDENFTALRVDAKHAIKTGDFLVTTKVGGQLSSDGTPSEARFALGGKDRGSSFSSGFVTLTNGAYGSVTATKKIKNIVASAGLDGATGTSSTNTEYSVASAFAGAKYFYKPFKLYVDGQLSTNIGASLKGQDDQKLSLVVTKLF